MKSRFAILIGSTAMLGAAVAVGIATIPANTQEPLVKAASSPAEFPDGTATPSEMCGACHKAIYREFSEGAGSDLHWRPMKGYPSSGALLVLPGGAPPQATAHAVAGIDPFPLEALRVEEGGRRCIVCHYPMPLEYPDFAATRIERPVPRAAGQESGITCTSCHLTPDGKIRGSYSVNAPHATVADARIQTSVACAFCHSDGERVVGKQTQTFLEWREDYFKPGLGPQQCQDCHMPKTVRKLAEDFDVPERVVARHLWTGGHSFQRIASALNLAVVQREEGQRELEPHVANVGAGHSVPTGSNRRVIYLVVEIAAPDARVVARKEWMFAPWFANRPDDRTFVDQDRNGPEPIAATQADAQGPHETIVRAGEDRVLEWTPDVPEGRYVVRAALIHDLNRYNDRAFDDDQHEIARIAVPVNVAAPRPGVR